MQIGNPDFPAILLDVYTYMYTWRDTWATIDIRYLIWTREFATPLPRSRVPDHVLSEPWTATSGVPYSIRAR